jgi:hypothetical protein
MARWPVFQRRRRIASFRPGGAGAGSPACLEVSFCVAPWELWRKISLRPDAPAGALTLVENTPFMVSREWRKSGQSSLRELGAAAGSTERAVTLLEWMAVSGQARWDSEHDAVVLTHLIWLRECGLAAADSERRTFVLGDAGDPMARRNAADSSLQWPDRGGPA